MESLPPVVWSQLATKDDLAAIEGKFTELKGEFALQLARTTRTMIVAYISISVAMLGVMVAIVRTAPA